MSRATLRRIIGTGLYMPEDIRDMFDWNTTPPGQKYWQAVFVGERALILAELKKLAGSSDLENTALAKTYPLANHHSVKEDLLVKILEDPAGQRKLLLDSFDWHRSPQNSGYWSARFHGAPELDGTDLAYLRRLLLLTRLRREKILKDKDRKAAYNSWSTKGGPLAEPMHDRWLQVQQLERILDGDAALLSSAFTWSSTPQNREYWGQRAFDEVEMSVSDLAFIEVLRDQILGGILNEDDETCFKRQYGESTRADMQRARDALEDLLRGRTEHLSAGIDLYNQRESGLFWLQIQTQTRKVSPRIASRVRDTLQRLEAKLDD